MPNIITFPLKQKWGEEIEHKTLFNIDEDLVNYIKLLEEDIDKYNKELLIQGEKIYKAIEYINTMPLTKGTEWYRIQLLDMLKEVDKDGKN